MSIDQVAEGISTCYANSQALLSDAILLATNASQHRALSLTVLALEELAKVPDLHDQYLNPETRGDEQAWAEFWNRFVHHKPKQKRITAYGNIFAAPPTEANNNALAWSPFEYFLDPEVASLLDSVKQRGFYVDYVPPRFVAPLSTDDIAQAFAVLHAFTQERIFALGTWHVTPQRSLDFLSTCVCALSDDPGEATRASQLLTTFSDWATTFTNEELIADIYRAFAYFSALPVPDYNAFLPLCRDIYRRISPGDSAAIFKRIVADLKRSFEHPLSPQSATRARKMHNLALGFGLIDLSDSEFKQDFGFTPTPTMRKRFRDAGRLGR